MARSGSATKRVVAILVVAFCLMFLPAILVFWPSRIKLQTLRSPNGLHTADLVRSDHLDRNYVVRVDGSRVYVSPDFAPRHDLPYRETLVWDKTGRVVVLEIARHRIFGYNAEKRVRLSDEELLAVEFPPDPPLWEYYFESEWPGIGRVHRLEEQPETKAKQ